MRGAAMKIGQVLSTVEFTAIPESEREEFKATLASLRDDVPPLPFKAIEKLMKEELDMPVSQAFAEFEHEAFAAASIGQVHRATTKDGREVAVKVQYPGIAEAVETDLRNMQMLFPLIRRLAPGLDVNALAGELRERISDELDYEVEAQHHRAMERGWRGHPFVFIPPVDTQLSRRRILVTEFMAGRRFDVVKALPDAERDRFGEIVFRFFFGTLNYLRRAAGDPHPGNYLYLEDGRVGFLDFGLMRVVDADYLAGERQLAQAIMRDDAVAVKDGLATLGYLPNPDEFEPEGCSANSGWRPRGTWSRASAGSTSADIAEVIEEGSSPRSPYFAQMRRQTIPPQALLIRRMEGLVFATLGDVRAGADWHALGAEYWGDAPPSTPLGEEDAAFWGR